MQRRAFIIAGATTAIVAVGVGRYATTAQATNLTLEALSGRQLASDPNLLVVDIRSPEEWKESGVIEGALLVTYNSPESFLSAVAPNLKDGQRLALICRSGNRSSRAARQIAGMVEFPVVDIQGGMLRILKEGYRPVAPTRAKGCQSC